MLDYNKIKYKLNTWGNNVSHAVDKPSKGAKEIIFMNWKKYT